MTVSGFDVIVVGLGTVGAATCMELSRRGVSVVGLDAFRPPHQRGSHHGESRSIRRAYLEGTGYVPMVLRAWELWRRLEKDAGRDLLVKTGNLTLSPPTGPALTGMLESARAYGIPFEELTAAEVRQRWPQLNPPDNFGGGLEKEAGVLFPEKSIHTFLSESEKAGATLRFNERVDHWESTGDHISIRTTKRIYYGGRLVLAAGARNSLLGKGMFIKPKRVPVLWVDPPHPSGFRLGEIPVNFWQLPFTRISSEPFYHEIYSLPVIRPGGRVKVAAHSPLADSDPDMTADDVTVDELAPINNFIDNFIPSLSARNLSLHTCYYSSTPDGDFILGPLSEHPHVFSAALAGHGFKFAPVLGEIMADMTMGHAPSFDLSKFSIKRFQNPESTKVR